MGHKPRANGALNTLMISTELPAGPMTGGRIRTYQLACALTRLGPVTILGFTLEGEQMPELEAPLRAIGVPWHEPPLYVQMRSADSLSSRRAYRHLAEEVCEPWIVSCYESERFRAEVAQQFHGRVDLVVVEHTMMGGYLNGMPRGVPTVLDLHNVHSRQAFRAVERGQEQLPEARRVRDYERSLIRRVELTIAVSELEARAARELAPGARIEVVPNGVDAEFFTVDGAPSVPGYLLFTGLMNYPPNIEGITWFAEEVLPALGSAELHVVGSTPAPQVQALACDRLIVHGEVPDTRPYQRRASVVVVPLLSGGGTRLKILEAAACGNAIVSTSVGAEGLDLVPGRDLLIADSPAEFVRAVCAVLADDELRVRLGRDARRAAERYRWEVIGDRLRNLVQPLAAPGLGARKVDSGRLSRLS